MLSVAREIWTYEFAQAACPKWRPEGNETMEYIQQIRRTPMIHLWPFYQGPHPPPSDRLCAEVQRVLEGGCHSIDDIARRVGSPPRDMVHAAILALLRDGHRVKYKASATTGRRKWYLPPFAPGIILV